MSKNESNNFNNASSKEQKYHIKLAGVIIIKKEEKTPNSK